MGRILDKTINRRLKKHLERTDIISDKQYAYQEGRGTIDALNNFMSILETNKNEERHSTIVALDLSNAFNNAWQAYIRKQLGIADADMKLPKMCESFLIKRTVKSEDVEIRMEKGCPLGSSLGPTLWNVVM